MNIIIRNYKAATKLIKNVKNLSIGDQPGFFIEVDNYNELFGELDKEGYNINLSYYQHFNQMKWYRIENIKGAFHSIRVSIIS